MVFFLFIHFCSSTTSYSVTLIQYAYNSRIKSHTVYSFVSEFAFNFDEPTATRVNEFF